MFSETFIAREVFPNIIISQVYHTRMVSRIRACEPWQNFCEHEQASTHLIFASNSSRKGQILRALLNWMGPFDTPSYKRSFTVAHNCHGKIFLLTAKSISPRQNQFRHGKINFLTAKSISQYGKISFITAKSFSSTAKYISPRQNNFG